MPKGLPPRLEPLNTTASVIFEHLAGPSLKLWFFCRWTDMGGEIWLDLQSSLIHAGTTYFKGDTATQIEASKEQRP